MHIRWGENAYQDWAFQSVSKGASKKKWKLSLGPFMSMKSRILLAVAGFSLISILVVGGVSYHFGRTAIEASIGQRVDALRVARAESVRSRFLDLRRSIQLLAETPWLQTAALELREGFSDLNRADVPQSLTDDLDRYYLERFLPSLEGKVQGTARIQDYRATGNANAWLQHHFVLAQDDDFERKAGESADLESAYFSAYRQYHQRVADFVEAEGIDDLYLIDSRDSDIIYSFAKEVDFATNLKNGPYTRSGLAQAVNKAVELRHQGAVAMVDLSEYTPIGLETAGFMAVPVLDHRRIIAILAIRFSSDRLTEALTSGLSRESLGLGRTGQLYLVGSDGDIRTKLVPGGISAAGNEEAEVAVDMAMDAEQTRLQLVGRARNGFVPLALDGENGVGYTEGQFHREVLSAYGPLGVDEDLVWGLVAEIDKEEALEPVRSFERNLLIWSCGVMLLAVLIAYVVARRLTGRLARLSQAIGKFTSGDAKTKLELRGSDEVAALSHEVGKLASQVSSRETELRQRDLENNELLESILPVEIARRVRQDSEELIADRIENVSVMVAVMRGFADEADRRRPEEVVQLMDQLVSEFDEAAAKNGVERVKIAGETFVAASGMTIPRLDHAQRTLALSQDLVRLIGRFNRRNGTHIDIRIGIDSGPVISGVIGKRKFAFDLWGRTVSIAHRILVEGDHNTIRLAEGAFERFRENAMFKSCPDVASKAYGTLKVWEHDQSGAGDDRLASHV